MPRITRRSLVTGAAAAGVAAQLYPFAEPAAAVAAQPPAAAPVARAEPPAVDDVDLHWLEGTPTTAIGSTWGVPWPKGALPGDQQFSLRAAGGAAVAVQSWATGFWPDGSLKWSAHAIGAGETAAAHYTLAPGTAAAPASPVRVIEERRAVVVDTGVIRVRIGRRGRAVVDEISRGGVPIARDGHLVGLRQDSADGAEVGRVRQQRFASEVAKVTVEQRGPVRAVVRIEGKHRAEQGRREWLPFSIRLYLYAGSDGIRMVHTFVFDGNANTDFISGLGIRFTVPQRDLPYHRHVRFAGSDGGVFGEAVQGITGLRRDPGAAVRAAQIAGTALPDVSTWDTRVSTRLQWIPTWGDYSLRQLTADGFQIHKRTAPGRSWIASDSGTRAAGLGYVGGVSGGLAFGLRHFWQLHPTQLDIRSAASAAAEITVWLWSPDATPMDLRFYHDGLAEDTFAKQLDALEITYEDFQPDFGTPFGVARTSELMFWALPATPDAAGFAALAQALDTPPQVVATPQRIHAAGVFGNWAPVDRSTPQRVELEDRLDFLFNYHRQQQDVRSWYGFWNYGDIMHTYDTDRHVWRYDIGGFAWDNSELSSDLWLWYHFLRTGRADAFRFAEAMTRHTGEVDSYHLGQWADLGTRHGVMHWGDSAKQQRISTAAYRRMFYFLTADERVGDLMRDLVDADESFLVLDPLRKVRTEPYTPDRHALSIGFGTDWSALAAAWLTEWERGGAPVAKQKLLDTMRTIAAQPNGFVQGSGLYDLDTGKFAVAAQPVVSVSSLSAVFGLVEMCSELIDLVDMPDFVDAWLQYCRLYNGTADEQIAEVGVSFGVLNLQQAHSRLTAYAAVRTGNTALADRAWSQFHTGQAGYARDQSFTTVRVAPPAVLKPVDEAAWVSTNATAQYGLAAIQLLALIGDRAPA